MFVFSQFFIFIFLLFLLLFFCGCLVTPLGGLLEVYTILILSREKLNGNPWLGFGLRRVFWVHNFCNKGYLGVGLI